MSTVRGGLRLPAAIVGVGADHEEAIHEDWDTYGKAVNYVQMELGLPPPEEPDSTPPTLTIEDLESSGKDYTDKYLKILGWFNYAQQKEVEAECQVLQLTNEMKQIAARMREGMRSSSTRETKAGSKKAPPAAEMEDKIRLDPRYLELGQLLQFQEHVKKLVEAKRMKYEAELKLMSRQVEIKRQDYESTNRAGAINGQRGMPNGQTPRGMRNPG